MQILNNSHRYEVLRRALNNVEKREELLTRFIDRVCKSGYVKEVYLVGLRVRGNHRSSSDFDIVVVVENEDVLEVAEYISSLRREPIPVDIIVLTENDLEDPIYREMLRYRKKLC